MIRLIIFDLDDTTARTTETLQGEPERLHHLVLAPGAQEFLEWYSGRKILLTMGSKPDQENKLEVLQIRPYFHEVVVAEFEVDKVLKLFKIVRESLLDPAQVAVIGDRVDLEIRWGNCLGCRTVRVKLPNGKYSSREPNPAILDEKAEYTVQDFFELRQLPLFT